MAKEKTVKKKSITKIVILILMLLTLISSAFAIWQLFKLSSIENLIRYIVIGILVIIDIIILIKGLRSLKKRDKNKHSKKIGFIVFMTLYTIICSIVGVLIFYLIGQLQNMNTGLVTYSSSLVTMGNNPATKIDDIKNFKLGVLSDEKSPDGYIIPQEIIKQHKLNDANEIITYDDYPSMITDLYVGEISGMILPTTYPSMFKAIPGYENIENDTKIIISKEKEMKKADVSEFETASSGKDITEPFTILLMGIDSTAEDLQKNAVANGDTLILVTFNPKTLNATMLSIPRDSYVPIACWSNRAENKITHAAAYGTDCMMNTIENYLDVNIDYYAKINFKGLVKLVNAVGGVEIDVKQTLCTDDSNRGEQVCINPGYQTLDGEHALVYARNRYDLPNGDFGRNQHQQEIVIALANKLKDVTSVSKFMEILNTISNSLDTNLTKKQMLSFYNVVKDIIKKSLSSDKAELINIQQLYLAGNGQRIYDERARMVLYNYIPNKNSRNDIVKVMKQNLGLLQYEPIKSFSFSVNAPYEKQIIGKGPYKSSSLYRLLPDFTGDSIETARATANRLGISVIFEGTSGHVVAQNYPAFKRIDLMNGSLKLTLSGNGKDDNKDDDKENKPKPPTGDGDKEDTKPPTGDGDKEDTKPPTGDGDKEDTKPPTGDGDKEDTKPPTGDGDKEETKPPTGGDSDKTTQTDK